MSSTTYLDIESVTSKDACNLRHCTIVRDLGLHQIDPAVQTDGLFQAAAIVGQNIHSANGLQRSYELCRLLYVRPVAVEAGHDRLEIAAVALRIARAEEKQRPVAPISEVVTQSNRSTRDRREPRSRRDRQEMRGNTRKPNLSRSPKPRGDRPQPTRSSHEDGMVRLLLSRGRQDGVRPNDVVGAIAANANIPGREIGKIFIQDERTYVDIPEQYVSQVLARSGVYRIHQQEVEVERA